MKRFRNDVHETADKKHNALTHGSSLLLGDELLFGGSLLGLAQQTHEFANEGGGSIIDTRN